MIDFLAKHKERVTLAGVGLAFLFFVGGGIYLQKKKQQEKEVVEEIVPKTVELKVRQSGGGNGGSGFSGPINSFFLKPSPDELLQQLASMENLNADAINSKFILMRVLWPVFFFTLEQSDDGKIVLLADVAEDGFGVEIRGEVDTVLHPQLQRLTGGEKIWIGGEILAVDPAGTGTVYLTTEHIGFGDEPGSLSPQ